MTRKQRMLGVYLVKRQDCRYCVEVRGEGVPGPRLRVSEPIAEKWVAELFVKRIRSCIRRAIAKEGGVI